MKDQAIEVARREVTDQAKRNRLREYLQHVLLRQLFERDFLAGAVFHGGTALRIVHDLPRFSEDLDFHLAAADPQFTLREIVDEARQDLEMAGYQVSLSAFSPGNVQSCMVNFEGLLYECGLSPHSSQKLKVKLEVDRNPPAGFGVEKKLINAYFPFVVVHHDRPSFLSGKLHAVLQRPFIKGRDFFDLLFYLSRWKDLTPNFSYLNNALKQTHYTGPASTEKNWKALLVDKVKSVDWEQVRKDVGPFLLRPQDMKAFGKEFLLQLLDADA